jgi:hypothetical protein
VGGVGVGGGGSAAGGAAADDGFTISGSIVAGPVLNTNGLVVTAYKADGSVLASGTVNADGTYTITVTSSYTGTILVRVVDTNPAADYFDEASASTRDLTTDLRAVTTVSGPGYLKLRWPIRQPAKSPRQIRRLLQPWA